MLIKGSSSRLKFIQHTFQYLFSTGEGGGGGGGVSLFFLLCSKFHEVIRKCFQQIQFILDARTV